MPDQNLWSAVDAYFNEALLEDDPILTRIIEQSAAAGLPPINVTRNQGAFLNVLARITGSRRILELGTLGRLQHRLARPCASV